MNILAFDTSLDKTYIALETGEKRVLKMFETNEINYHSAYLISGIKQIADEGGISLKDLNLIAVNHGPGSFTGIRAGVTTAKTLSKELSKPAIGVNSLDILRKTYENLDPAVVLDARREMFYFSEGGEISLIPYQELGLRLTKNVLICDRSSLRHLQNLENVVIINFEDDRKNLGEALLDLAKLKFNDSADFSWYNLNPLYIQPPPIHKKN